MFKKKVNKTLNMTGKAFQQREGTIKEKLEK